MHVCSVVSDSSQPHVGLHVGLHDCRLPGSSVHGNFQARILQWVAISVFRGSSQPRDQTHISCVSCIGKWILYQLSHSLSRDNSQNYAHMISQSCPLSEEVKFMFRVWHWVCCGPWNPSVRINWFLSVIIFWIPKQDREFESDIILTPGPVLRQK